MRLTKKDLSRSLYSAGRTVREIAIALETTEANVERWVRGLIQYEYIPSNVAIPMEIGRKR